MTRVKKTLDPPGEDGDKIAVDAGEQPGGHFHDRDPGSQAGIHSAHFQADITAADHQHRFRNRAEIQCRGRVQDTPALERNAG